MSDVIENEWQNSANKAVETLEQNNIDDAIRLMQQAIDLNPDESWPYIKYAEWTIRIINPNNYKNLLENIASAIQKAKKYGDRFWAEYLAFMLCGKIREISVKNILDTYDTYNTWDDHQQNAFLKCITDLLSLSNTNSSTNSSRIQRLKIEYLKPFFFYNFKPKYYQNKLENVCILLNSKEIKANKHHDLYNQILKKTPPETATDIALTIAIDDPDLLLDEKQLSNIFTDIRIMRIDIPDQYNCYQTQENVSSDYGKFCGPNYMFFDVIKNLKAHNTTLMLETDIILSHNWLQKLKMFARNSGSFWISGATYDGDSLHEDFSHPMNNHINGGTAMYATGNAQFLEFIELCKTALKYYCMHNQNINDTAYDYFIYMLIEDMFNMYNRQNNIWKFIKRQYLVNNLVYNYSPLSDQDNDPSSIKEKFCYAILHKK